MPNSGLVLCRCKHKLMERLAFHVRNRGRDDLHCLEQSDIVSTDRLSRSRTNAASARTPALRELFGYRPTARSTRTPASSFSETKSGAW